MERKIHKKVNISSLKPGDYFYLISHPAMPIIVKILDMNDNNNEYPIRVIQTNTGMIRWFKKDQEVEIPNG